MAKKAKAPNELADAKVLNSIAADTGDPSIAEAAPKEGDQQPSYQVIGDSKIPVSKSRGKLWQSRRDQAKTKLKSSGDVDNWDECIRYFKNDQSSQRGPNYIAKRGDSVKGNRLSETGRSSENIVFANVTALVPATYAKNPDCSITAEDQDDENLAAWCTTAQKLINTLAGGDAAPCFNLKPKMRKAVVMTTLTNLSYLEVGYTKKDESSEQALQDLQKLSKDLQDAKGVEELRNVEGKIEALEATIDVLRPSGPWVKFRRPHDVLKDPDALEDDLSDSRWVMVKDYLSTAFIRAKFTKPDGEGKYASIYDPTHIVGVGSTSGVQDEINQFTLFSDENSAEEAGFKDDNSYKKAQRTCVWWVWDRVTQRVELYHDKNWTWPIWVWDDPYKLDTFFPIVPMQFYTGPDFSTARGEVSYYLEQQDEINDMNDLIAKARSWARGNMVYNKNLVPDSKVIDKFLEGGDEPRAIGIDAPPDADLTKILTSITPPALDHKELFNKDSILQSIDRVSSVSSVMRGTEYKTNTTNKAIESYTSQDQTRLDEKTDCIEDTIGSIMWMILQMCAQFMSNQEVSEIIGQRYAQNWKPMDSVTLRQMVDIEVAGGSSQKPTSSAKKKEAMQMVQLLGQFAKAGAGASVILALKVLERSFGDSLTITDQDWKMLEDAIKAELTRGQSAGGAPPPSGGGQPQASGGQSGHEGGAPAGPQQGPGAEGAAPLSDEQVSEAIKVVAQLVDEMPPEMKGALGRALEKGMSITEALPRIMEAMGGGGNPQTATQPN